MKQRFSKRTRLVSALLTLAMVFTFLPFSAFAATDSYGPVYITDANVPDKTFREYLLKQFDKDGNGVLTPAERYQSLRSMSRISTSVTCLAFSFFQT